MIKQSGLPPLLVLLIPLAALGAAAIFIAHKTKKDTAPDLSPNQQALHNILLHHSLSESEMTIAHQRFSDLTENSQAVWLTQFPTLSEEDKALLVADLVS